MSRVKEQYFSEINDTTCEPMYDDGGSALAHYKKVLKEAKQTVRFKYVIGDAVAHKGKVGTIIARQYFEYEFPMTEYSVKFQDDPHLSFWVKEGELSEPQSILAAENSKELMEAL